MNAEAVDRLEILTVCSFNQTRSVMAMALLQAGFDRRVGAGAVTVRSAGFGSEGVPAHPAAVEAMLDRGLDVSDHRSRRIGDEDLTSADLVLAAERDHVMAIATMNRGAFHRTFTIPEFADLAIAAGRSSAGTVEELIRALGADRTPADYLADRPSEIADPTGRSRRRFGAAVVDLQSRCEVIVDVLARRM